MNSSLLQLMEDYVGEGFRESPLCPICGGGSRVAHAAFNINPANTYRFAFRICHRCGHGWIDPLPSQGLLSFLYSKGSPSVIGSDWNTLAEPPLSLPARMVLQSELGHAVPAKRYFELGVGKGELYKRFIAAGWHCSGVEPGSWGRAFRDVYPDMVDVPPSLRADVIVGLDVLEHLADPSVVLEQLRRLAAPGARLYCSMPNRQSFRARLWRTRWRMLRPLGHVNYWSRQSLTQAMHRAGFGIIKLYATDLWEPRRPRSARDLVLTAIERLGMGDQWIAIGEAQSEPCPR